MEALLWPTGRLSRSPSRGAFEPLPQSGLRAVDSRRYRRAALHDAEILELHARLETSWADPGAVELLCLSSWGTPGCARQLARAPVRPATPIRRLHPVTQRGRPSRPSRASRPWRSQADRLAARLPARAKGIVVLAEAQRLGPWELSLVVESSVREGGRVIVFASEASLEARFGTASRL